ncbi:MAG: hypothetical protein HKN91_05670 [Acidimicrobiia bacterium]|nr:hypothetical protein [Acidimicrobiia bacterium]
MRRSTVAGVVFLALTLAVAGCSPEPAAETSAVVTTLSQAPPTTMTSAPASTTPSPPTTATTTTILVEEPLCALPERFDPGDGFFTSFAYQLIGLRAEAERLGGGFVNVTLLGGAQTPGGEFDEFFLEVEIGAALWEADEPLVDVDAVALRSRYFDPVLLDFPVDAVAFITNDGAMRTVSAVDVDGCLSAFPGMEGDRGATLMEQLLEISLPGRWERRVGMPVDLLCDWRDTPAQPERQDLMIATALANMTEVHDERERIDDLRRQANLLGERNRASIIDIFRQLFAGVPVGDLDYQYERVITIRLPGVARDDYSKLWIVLLEGDQPTFSSWLSPQRARSEVQLPVPRSNNAVSFYIGTPPGHEQTVAGFSDLPEDFQCPDQYANVEPYAVVPAEAFEASNEVINLNAYRP